MKGKIKVMNAKPEVSDQEIHESMDFEKLLVEKKKLDLQLSRRRVRRALLAISGFIILSSAVYIITFQPFSDATTQKVSNGLESNTKPSATNTIPESVTPGDETAEASPDKKTQPVVSPQKSAAQPQRENNPETSPVLKDSAGATASENMYEQAVPVDGYPALYEYFKRELTYPANHIADSIRGVVTVIFVIDVSGRPVNIKTENSLGPAFDNEAIRVIKDMPAWTPATFNGKPVPSKIRLPLTFETSKVKLD